MKKNITDLPFVLCLIFTAFVLVFTAAQKKGTFVDEMLTYDLANRESERVSFMIDFLKNSTPGDIAHTIRDMKEKGWSGSSIYRDFKASEQAGASASFWNDSSYFTGFITAGEDSRFDFLSVMYNATGDSHPPFYYYFVHLISSLFPGTFSLWFGLVINIIFMLASCALLYQMVINFYGPKGLALLTTLVYVLSLGALSTVLIIRMYSILLFFVLSFLYVNLCLAKNGFKFTKKYRLLYIITAVLGFYTQYFFVIYAFFLIATVITYLFCQKTKEKRRLILPYLIYSMAAGLISLVIFPFSIKTIFFGSFGKSTLDHAFEIQLGETILTYLNILIRNLAVNPFVFIVLSLLFLGSFLWFVLNRRDVMKAWVRSLRFPLYIMLLLPAVFYFLVASVTTPFISDRYLMCIYPTLVLSAIFSLWKLLSYKTSHAFPIVCGIGIFLSAAGLLFSSPSYAYRDQAEKNQLISDGDGTICIYVGENNGWKYKTCLALMSSVESTAILLSDQIDDLPKGRPAAGSYDRVVVCIERSFDQEAILEQIKNTMGFSVASSRKLADTNDEYAAMFLLELE